MKAKKHEFTVVVTTNKPCSRREALAMLKDDGDCYATHYPCHDVVSSFKTRFKNKPSKTE